MARPKSSIFKHGTTGYQRACRCAVCKQAAVTAVTASKRKHKGEWRQNNPDTLKAYSRAHPEQKRMCIWRRSGIDMSRWSWKQYLAMLEIQGGRCAVCNAGIVASNSQLTGSFRLACVDHDHSTGRVRGLLCRPCNSAIGLLADNIETVTRLVTYLQTAAGGNHV